MGSKLYVTTQKILDFLHLVSWKTQANVLRCLEKQTDFKSYNERNEDKTENILTELCRLLKNLNTVYISSPLTTELYSKIVKLQGTIVKVYRKLSIRSD